MTVLAQHSKKTFEHGTPLHIVEMGREVMGGIDCDPCSSAYWNKHVVKAECFYDVRDEVLVEREHRFKSSHGMFAFDTFFINPPGGLVKEFWEFAIARWQEGSSVFWVGFSLEQMTYLQRRGLMHGGIRRCILPSRLAFLQTRRGAVARLKEAEAKALEDGEEKAAEKLRAKITKLSKNLGGPPVPGKQPTHGNYLAFLPSDAKQIARFDEQAKALGAEPF